MSTYQAYIDDDIVLVGRAARLIGEGSVAANAGAEGVELEVESTKVFKTLSRLSRLVVVHFDPGSADFTIEKAELWAFPFFEGPEDVTPQGEGANFLCGGRYVDMTKGMMGESGIVIPFRRSLETRGSAQPAGAIRANLPNTVVWEVPELFPVDVPTSFRCKVTATNSNASNQTFRLAYYALAV